MRFVPVKTIEQQSLTTLHRCRDLLVKNRTMLVNALRAHLAEFGFVAAKGIGKLPDLIEIVSEAPRCRRWRAPRFRALSLRSR